MASIDTAVWTRKRLRFQIYQSRLTHKKRKYNIFRILDLPAPRNSVTCNILMKLKRRGRFLKRRPANPEFCSSIKGGVVTFAKY